jgi:hypothetical protein
MAVILAFRWTRPEVGRSSETYTQDVRTCFGVARAGARCGAADTPEGGGGNLPERPLLHVGACEGVIGHMLWRWPRTFTTGREPKAWSCLTEGTDSNEGSESEPPPVKVC